MMEVKNLSKRLGNETILKNINFSINEPGIIALIGPNGAGKTTLLRLLLGVLKPTTGTIRWLNKFGDKREPSVVFEDLGQYDNLTVYQNLMFYSILFGIKEKKNRIYEVLERTGMSYHAKTSFGKLSRGQRQRVAIARSLLRKPELVFFDEPALGLDLEANEILSNILYEYQNNSKTLVFLSTHDLGQVVRFASRVMLISEKTLLYDGPVSGFLGADNNSNDASLQTAQIIEKFEEQYRVRIN